jgi:hypothetical protein
MKTKVVLCGMVLLGLSSVADARGRGAARNPKQLVVTKLQVTPSAEGDGPGRSLELGLDVQVASTVGSDVTLTAVTACKVNGAMQIDTTELGGDLSDLNVGDSKHFDATPFSASKLDAMPSQCNVTIRQNQDFGDAKPIAQFCYAAGHVARGACR